MSFGEDGSFGSSRAVRTFAKHYSSGGVLIAPPETAPSAMTSASLPKASLPSPATPRPEVIAAIHETALRYGGHATLRNLGISLTEWSLLFQANIEIESRYNHSARSHVGAIGLGQLMPDTARALGVDPLDLHQNLDGSARYLLLMLERFGSMELALAGYNAGPEAVARHNGIPPYRETIGHVQKVMAVLNRLKGESV